MPLSWNEVKTRAIKFSKEWENETSEHAEAKSFWDAFFDVFGITRRRIASFEKLVKKQDGNSGFIDLLWKGVMLVEHKSKGRNLDNAEQQAFDYFTGLKEHELPRFVLVSDFERFRLKDLEKDVSYEFTLSQLADNVHLFGFILGYEQKEYKEQDPVNIEAAERMGKLHDALEVVGYKGHSLEVYLVRLLFCLFAEDTGIFQRTQFQEYISLHTKEDGSDLAMHLAMMFQVLNTPDKDRLSSLDESLNEFPYINGKLFEEQLPFAAFNSQMRQMLLHACALDWSKISPAIFGAMFQSVMNPKERRNLGAHYTSEKNIQKVIRPLFLDALYAELDEAKGNNSKLNALHKKIASLHFLDPACGCGNFLIVAYRELRVLELEILKEINKRGQLVTDISQVIKVDVDQFGGIEYDEFPARIAEVAMWLIDHQMNRQASDILGEYFVRIPIQKAAKIVHGNALRIDWDTVIPKDKLSYILGNPPFYGSRNQTSDQKKDTDIIFGKFENYGVLDYVTCWYLKAAELIQNTNIVVAFVSTNSIIQGIQVPTLWSILVEKYNIVINFAHQTFKWSNEAKGNAAVYCVIIGFSLIDSPIKKIFTYNDIKGEPLEKVVNSINSYLVEGNHIFIKPSSKPIASVPMMMKGNAAIDNGNFIFNDETSKNTFLTKYPNLSYLVRKFIGSDELINNYHRYVLWLKDAKPEDIKNNEEIKFRLNKIRTFRLNSPKTATQKYADFPSLFMEDRQPNSDYLMIPVVSSENRKYIPIGYLSQSIIANYSAFILPNASLFIFGQLTSEMHMTWVKYVCGRLESRFRYSNTIVYNNYPFPLTVSEANKKKVEQAAQAVLDARAKYPNSSLADLYDPLAMPPDLVKAHQALDKAVDLCYRPQPFTSELNRIEFLFQLYETYTAPMFADEKKKKKKKK